MCGALIACGDAVFVLPAAPAGPEAQTEVLVFGSDTRAEPEGHYVIDLRAGAPPIRIDLPDPGTPRRFEAFIITASVDDLGVQTGRDVLGEGELLPASEYVAFAADYRDDRIVGWRDEPAPRWSDVLRFAGIGPRGCLERGGCLVTGECRRPCSITVTPESPTPPTPPQLTCPAGWASTPVATPDDESEMIAEACEPWPSGTGPCAPDTLRWPGLGCRPLSAPCPVAPERFAAPRPGITMHVLPGATNGDGTRARPVGTVADALSRLPNEGGGIMLAAGDFPVDDLRVDRPLTLLGACPSQVRLQGTFRIETTTVSLEGLTLQGGLLADESDLTLIGVRVQTDTRRSAPALRSTAGRLRFDRVRIDATDAPGLLLAGANASGIGLDLRAATGPGVLATEGSTLRVSDWVWASTDANTDAFAVFDSSSLVGERGLLEGARVAAKASTIALTDTVVRDVQDAFSTDDTALTIRRLWSDGVRGLTLGAGESDVDVADAVLVAADDASGSIVGISNEGLERGTRFTRTVFSGPAVNAANIVGNVELTDVRMLRTGTGISITSSQLCRGTRVALSHLAGLGAFIRSSDCDFEDVTVQDLAPQDCRPIVGFDVSQSDVSSARLSITDVQGTGVRVERGTWTAQDVRILRPAMPASCAPGAGLGIEVDSATAIVDRFVVRGATQAGLRLVSTHGTATTVAASVGIVAGGQYGLEIGLAAFDFAPLLDRVDYSDNDFVLLDFGGR